MFENGLILEGKYRVLRLIGEGGMGVVCEAEHTRIRRRVAVKLLSAALAQKPDALKRFELEAEAAGRVRHDNICEVIDFGISAEGAPYLVMPLLSGKSLAEILRESPVFPIERACDVSCQILGALVAAHEAGIIHRDLKPENVFITRVGDRADFVKILDFGISKVVGDTPAGRDEKNLTKTGWVLGTPAYMAPEQARGARDLDGRVDVYATGVILYEMLTGKRPFNGDSFNEVLWMIWNQPLAPPRSLRSDLPADLDLVVLRAMARDRTQRFAGAEEFRDAVAAAVEAFRQGSSRPATTLVTSEAPSSPARPDPADAARIVASSTAPERPAGRAALWSSVRTPLPATTDSSLSVAALRRRPIVLLASAVAVALFVGGIVYLSTGTSEPRATVADLPAASASGLDAAKTVLAQPLAERADKPVATLPQPARADGATGARRPQGRPGRDAGADTAVIRGTVTEFGRVP